jgi:bifunctional UDP-N-acetylglucosamine pyrophosphorylase/glucosamine-1-phosphate N-acetyltransferase
MKALLLCGGIGKRRFPIAEDKLLLNFLGRPLLRHQLDKMKEAGLQDLVVVANPHNVGQIERIIRDATGIRASFVVQEKALGIANALETARRFLKDELLIVNPNDVFDTPALTSLLRGSRRGSAAAYLVGYEVKDYFPGGYLVTNSRNELRKIVEKPPRGEEPSHLVNILLHLHTEAADLLQYIGRAETSRDDVYECALDLMVREGRRIKVVPYSGYWKAIKYPWHIFAITRYFLDRCRPHISPTAQVSPRAVVEGRVVIEDGVRVLENAVIRGPAYIGAKSIIGNNVLVRDYSHIGRNCVVGYSTEVKGSYIGDNCWFHSSYVGDSVIDDNCSLAAGTVLANFRFDERSVKVKVSGETIDTGLDKFGAIMGAGSKTGINASIMPGVRIGPGSFVGSHVCLMRDLPANKLVMMEPRYRVLDGDIIAADNKKADLMKKLERL